MKAQPSFEQSNREAVESNDSTKRELGPNKKLTDTFYARHRRLEQRIVNLESAVTTLRRDAWRIEKKLRMDKAVPSPVNTEAVPRQELPAELFG